MIFSSSSTKPCLKFMSTFKSFHKMSGWDSGNSEQSDTWNIYEMTQQWPETLSFIYSWGVCGCIITFLVWEILSVVTVCDVLGPWIWGNVVSVHFILWQWLTHHRKYKVLIGSLGFTFLFLKYRHWSTLVLCNRLNFFKPTIRKQQYEETAEKTVIPVEGQNSGSEPEITNCIFITHL